ncbi:MAG TPA: hypothetical protein PLP59_10745, partial [Thermotogota bacterium]|nr:hypothetical protein [Thermotogota bacterium]
YYPGKQKTGRKPENSPLKSPISLSIRESREDFYNTGFERKKASLISAHKIYKHILWLLE